MAASAGICCRIPAVNCSPVTDKPSRDARFAHDPRRLPGHADSDGCAVPLPVPSGFRIGEKMARWPARAAMASQFAQDDCLIGGAQADRGLTVTSYWRGPYSGKGFVSCRADLQRRHQACAEITLLAE